MIDKFVRRSGRTIVRDIFLATETAIAVAATVVAIAVLLPTRGDAACITDPIDRSQTAEKIRQDAITDFIRRRVVYKITRTSDTAVEVQTTREFLELPFDVKQVLAWAVFSQHFDGKNESQSLAFTDSRTLQPIGAFDPCRGLTLR